MCVSVESERAAAVRAKFARRAVVVALLAAYPRASDDDVAELTAFAVRHGHAAQVAQCMMSATDLVEAYQEHDAMGVAA